MQSNQQTRQRVLDRLWQIAELAHEVTKGNINGQLKALTMIVAIEGLIPNRHNTRQTTALAQTLSKATQPAPTQAPPASKHEAAFLQLLNQASDIAARAVTKTGYLAAAPKVDFLAALATP